MLKVMALSVAMVALLAGVTIAQVTSKRIEIDKVTCAELLASRDEARFRLLVYLNGYMNGLRGQKVWDPQTEGKRIDRAESECKAAPTRTVLDVFTTVWPR
jgi:HdeA/HdeB family protein